MLILWHDVRPPCPYCGSAVKKDSSTCGFCGESLPAMPPSQPTPMNQGSQSIVDSAKRDALLSELSNAEPIELEVAGTKECPRCGEEVALAALQCKYCGGSFQDDLSRRLDQQRWDEGSIQIPHRGGTILSMALGGLVCGFFAPVAVILAICDLWAMHQGTMDSAGELLTWLGLVTGIAVIVLTVLAINVWTLRLW